MIDKVKIFGAGSIGNHMAHAARTLGWSVDICDVDPDALARTRDQIYPSRYGSWDQSIGLYDTATVPAGGYDLIVIGTPPDLHMSLALTALEERPAAILIEKPASTPLSDLDQQVYDRAQDLGVRVFVGYDHVVGQASHRFGQHVATGSPGTARTLDVEFREYWGGIFAAHPWLDGPADSYLGYWRRGGGALGEHSHALNMWQHMAHLVGAGRVVQVSAMLDIVSDGQAEYDRLAALHLVTENGLCGRVVQDVVTQPTRKWARLQGEHGYVEWIAGHEHGADAVIHATGNAPGETELFHKTRPDDFIAELEHIERHVAEATPSPLDLSRGLDTMLVIAAAHRSHREQRAVRIDHQQGYNIKSLTA